jgi:hypothetical protein
VKAITLTQPWATLVAIGAKRFETRSWRPWHMGPLAIHAAKGFPVESQALCFTEPFLSVLTGAGVFGEVQLGSDPEATATLNPGCLGALPRGTVIATAALAWWGSTRSIVLPDLLDQFGGPHEREFGNYGPGRWAWRLADVRRLGEPVPARGALGLWEWVPPAELALCDVARGGVR